MKVSELKEILSTVDDDLEIVTIGHYGEVDCDLDSVLVQKSYRDLSRRNSTYYLILEGLPVSYEEPD